MDTSSDSGKSGRGKIGGGGEGAGGGAGGLAGELATAGSGTFDPATATLEEFYSREYKRFEDKASGTHTYAGDGRDVVEFFDEHSDYNELIEGMNDGQREAFRAWTRGYFMDGSQYKGWDKMDTQEHHYTSRMDHILDRATLDEGIVVTRRASGELLMGKGHRGLTLEEAQSMKGETIFSRGAMSTGAASQGLTIGDSSKPVEYRIHIAGGTKGAGMWIGDDRINGWGAEQREFVVNRDTYFKVGDSSYDSSRGIITTDIFFTMRGEHDYGSKAKSRSRRK